MPKVMIVDDEALTRDTLRDYLASDNTIEIVGEASNGKNAIQQATVLRPDVILMDMQMPVMDGVRATAEIHERMPQIGIIGLSTFATDRYVIDLLRAGASGYLVKDALPQQVIDAIHQVCAGESVLSSKVTRHVVKGLEASVPATATPDPALAQLLTEKELEVIQLLAQGMSNREMADVLLVTESTIKARFVRIMEKLGVRDRVQLLVTAISHGLVSVNTPADFSDHHYR